MPTPSNIPFAEAVADLAGKNLLPTSATSAQIQGWAASLRRQSFFSAKTLLEDLLDGYQTRIASVLQPGRTRRAEAVTPENPEGWVNVGYDPATARLEIKQLLDKLGYQPDPEKRGSIEDLSSEKRIDLVIKTNLELAQGAGHFAQSADPAVVEAFPCWELVRFEERKDKRDWPQRWRIASQVAGDVDAARVLAETGRMIARKDSEIWQQLGEGAGGYTDTLGNPFPPFAFSSGMWTVDVPRDEAEQLGLVTPETQVRPPSLDAENLFAQEESE